MANGLGYGTVRSDKMRVLQVVKGLRKTSGVATFVRELSDTLYANGVDVAIGMCRPDTDNWLPPQGKEPVVALDAALKDGWDIIHLHGLWDREIRIAARAALEKGIPLVWSPHGMLAPWALKYRWWKKCLPWHLYLKRLLKGASGFHVTSALEKDWIAQLGFRNRVDVIPLGTHLPSEDDVTTAHKEKEGQNEHTLLFVGRIHPVKGLDNLVDAWAKVSPKGWRLRVVGGENKEGYVAALEAKCRDLHVEASVDFAGAKYGEELQRAYAEADCLILPSFTENFGGVVVDALGAGRPVIASDKTPWRELEENPFGKCGWCVPNDPDSLAQAIGEMMAMSDSERDAMGVKGRSLVVAKYTWTAVSEQMMKVYEEMSKGK